MTLGAHQSENVVTKILAQTSKPALAQYLHSEIFNRTTLSLLKAIKKVPEDNAYPHRKIHK